LTRKDILRYTPDKIALMIASEFTRAANRAERIENVVACYERARELMGILETVSLAAVVSRRLRPIYQNVGMQKMLLLKDRNTAYIRQSSLELADELTRAASGLS